MSIISKLSISKIIQVSAFIIFSLFLLFIIRPGIKSAQQDILDRRDEIFAEVEEYTGLEFTYKSMSPLVLSSIELNDVYVHGIKEKSYAKSKRVIINLNIFDAIFRRNKSNPSVLLESVIFINGELKLHIDDLYFLERISKAGNTGALLKTKIIVKKIDLILDLNEIKVFAEDVRGSFHGILSRYSLKLNSRVKFSSDIGLPFDYVVGDASIDGNISKLFDSFSTSIKLKTISSDIGELKDVKVNLTLNKDELIIKNSDLKSNLDYKVKYTFPLEEVFVSIDGKSVLLSEVFKPNDSFNYFDKFIDSKFSGNFKGVYSWNSETFLYSSLGRVDFKEGLLPVPLSLNFHVIGDLDYLTVYYLNAGLFDGQIKYYGGLNLKNFFPEGKLKINNINLSNSININSDIDISIINSNFISVDYNSINVSGAKLNNLPSIIYVDENDISFQALKREGDGKFSLSGNYNISTGAFVSKVDVDKFNSSILKDIVPLKSLKKELDNQYLYAKGNFSKFENKLSYNINHINLADSNNESLFYLSGRGNDKEFSVDELTINYLGINLAGRIDGRAEGGGLEVNIDTFFNDYNYLFNIKASENRMTASGSYGFKMEVVNKGSTYIDLKTKKFPIKYNDYTIEPEIELKALLKDSNSFLFTLSKFDTLIKHERFIENPSLSITGSGSEDRITLDNIEYIDNISPVTGELSLTQSRSGYSLKAGFQGVESEILDIKASYIPKSENISLNIDFNNFSLGRLQNKRIKGFSSLNFAFLGNSGNFKGRGNISSDSIILDDSTGELNLDFTLTNKYFSLLNILAKHNNSVIKAPLVTYNFKDGKILGKVDSQFNFNDLMFRTDLTLDFTINPLDDILKIDKSSINKINGSIVLGDVYTNDDLLVRSKTIRIFNNLSALQVYSMDRNFKLFYSYNSGKLKAKIEKPYIVSLKADGIIKDENIDLSLRNINIDGKIANLFMPLTPDGEKRLVGITSMDINGYADIDGTLSQPNFNGLLWMDTELNVAYFLKDIDTSRLTLSMRNNKLTLLENTLKVGESGLINLKGDVIFDSWKAESAAFTINIPRDGKIPILYKHNNVVTEVDVYTDGLKFFYEPSGLGLVGRIVVSNGEFYTEVGSILEKREQEVSDNDIEVALEIEVGNNNKLYIPNKALPILQATAAQGDVLVVNYTSKDNNFTVEGKVDILEGQIDYSGTPFILTSGEVILNLTPENIDPYIKLIGSNNLIDENNRPVEVVLKYEGSLFTDFKPIFSSNPSKSEDEILRLIGQSISGGNVNSIVSSADFFTDAFIGKPLEDALKDILGVDFVKFESGALSSIIADITGLPNITNNSFDQESETEYNDPDNLSRIFNHTSLSLGNFISKDFFVTGGIATNYTNRLGLDYEFGVELNTPHFLVGFKVVQKDNFEQIKPEFGLSLEWILNSGK